MAVDRLEPPIRGYIAEMPLGGRKLIQRCGFLPIDEGVDMPHEIARVMDGDSRAVL
jgi:hypothetical protein